MKNEDQLIPRHTVYEGERFNKFGVKDFVKLILLGVNKFPLGFSSSSGTEELQREMERFFRNMETDLGTIKNSQKIFRRLLADTKFTNFLLNMKFPTFPDRYDYSESSAANDEMAMIGMDYLNRISTFLSGVPEYAPLRKYVAQFKKNNTWIDQMEQIAKINEEYVHYHLKAVMEITVRSTGDGDVDFRIKAPEMTVKFSSSSGTPVMMFNRGTGHFTIRAEKPAEQPKKKKRGAKKKPAKVQLIVCHSDFDQKTRTISDQCWEQLLLKAIRAQVGTFYKMKEGQSVTLTANISLNAKTNKMTAVVNTPFKTLRMEYLSLTNVQGYDQQKWVLPGEKYTRSKNTSLTDAAALRALRNQHLMTGSRSFVYSYISEFKEMFGLFSRFIMLGAIASFYQSKKGWVFPTVLPAEKAVIDITEGVNPLLFFNESVPPVPNDVMLSRRNNGFLITGANTGGKTAYTNMIAMTQLLAQLGLPVFAKAAKVSIKDSILCHYVESEDIGVNLSRYHSELQRLHRIIESVTPHSLVLFDEPFSGTSVDSGTDQAYQVLRVMASVGCPFVMNTHYHNLIDRVGKNGTSTVKNLHFLLPDPKLPKPTDYKVQEGGIRISMGEAIAMIAGVDYRSMILALRKRKIRLQKA